MTARAAFLFCMAAGFGLLSGCQSGPAAGPVWSPGFSSTLFPAEPVAGGDPFLNGVPSRAATTRTPQAPGVSRMADAAGNGGASVPADSGFATQSGGGVASGSDGWQSHDTGEPSYEP